MTNLVGRLALSAAALAAFGSFSLAQGLPKNVSELEKQIGLSDSQRKKMEAVDKKYQPKFQTISKKYEPQMVALRKKIEPLQKQAIQLQQKMNAEGKPIFDAMNKEKESVLTPDQVKKMKAILAKLAAQNKQSGGR